MKKNLMVLRALALSLMISLMGGQVAAKEYYDDCSSDMMDCCMDTPLQCGGWNVKARFGIAPSIFTGRSTVWGVSCENRAANTPVGSALLAFSDMPKFNDIFKTPGFTVAGEVGHALSDYAETFLEVSWRRYNGRDASDALITHSTGPAQATIALGVENVAGVAAVGTTAAQPALNDKIDDYSSIGGYAGWRRHFGRWWCSRLSVFVGAKVGILHRKSVNTNLRLVQTTAAPATVNGNPISATNPAIVHVASVNDGNNRTTLFRSQNTISGGPQVGFNFCFWKNFTFITQVEFVASGAFKSSRNFFLGNQAAVNGVVANPTGYSNIVFGETGVEMTFPVTFGFGYEF